jgi:hypothetical protein
MNSGSSPTTSTISTSPASFPPMSRARLQLTRRVSDAAVFSFLFVGRAGILANPSLINSWWLLVQHSRAIFTIGIKKVMSSVSPSSIVWYPKLLDYLESNYQSAISRTFYNFWYPPLPSIILTPLQ